MELKIQISNEEFSKMLSDGTEAHLKTLARGAVDKYIQDAIKQKIDNLNVDKMAEDSTNRYIANILHNKTGLVYFGDNEPKEWFMKLVKDALNESIPKYVKATSLKKKIDLEVNKKVKAIIDGLAKHK